MNVLPKPTSELVPRTQPPWDNVGLRHRVEGKETEQPSVLALQEAARDRTPEPKRRRKRR
jgi:hypothetical protein